MRIILVSKDLLFISRVKEVAGAKGHEVVVAKSEDALRAAIAGVAPEQSGVLLLDLERVVIGLDALSELVRGLAKERWRCISFYSHVHTDTGAAAKELGLGEVMPRSRFVQILPGVV